ncbi:MAG: PAS domain S-box protein, partial [Arcobacteraceae bacterium]
MTILFEAHFFARPVIEKMKLKFQDFYEKLRQKDKLIELQSKFFTNAHEGILITDQNNKIIDLNPAFEKVTGYTKEELIGKDPMIFKSGEHDSEFYRDLWNKLHTEGSFQGEIINKKKNNQNYVQNVSIFTLKNEYNTIENYFAIVSDITEKHITQQKLYFYANFDSLTKLPNRHSFYEKLKSIAASSKRNQTKFALIYIDLDDFKKINDSLGHDYGDKLLIIF